MMKSTRFLSLLALTVFSAGISHFAHAAIVVGLCAAGTQYATIQEAVNAAPSGAVIKVCPSGYTEQVVIDKPLTLEGMINAGTEGAFIQPPTGGVVVNDLGVVAQILVRNTSGVTISNLIVDEANSGDCLVPNVGIMFYDASGTVNKVAVHNQGGAAGVLCDSYGVLANVDTGSAETVTVENSDFRNQETSAIYAIGPGLNMKTLNNYIAGPDNFSGIPVGIEYGSGTMGTIQGNTVVNEIHMAGQSVNSSNGGVGILVFCSTSSVLNNTVVNTQTGIALYCPFIAGFASNSTISGNKIFQSRGVGDGIYIADTGNKILSNTIVGSAQSGIHFDATISGNGTGNTATGNSITEACAGILTTGTATNAVSGGNFNAVELPTLNGTNCGPLF